MRGLLASSVLSLCLGAGACGRDAPERPPDDAGARKAPSPPPRLVLPRTDPAAERTSPAGVYLFETVEMKITMYLDPDGAFRVVSFRKADTDQRTATGRWRLEGKTLHLTYETKNGEAIEPETVANRFADDRVVLKGPPDYPLIRQKVFEVR